MSGIDWTDEQRYLPEYGTMPLSTSEQSRVLKENVAYRAGKGPKPGFRARINLFCKDCLYDSRADGLGTWRKQVEDCGAIECPIYPLRPTSAYGPEEEPEDAEQAAGIEAQGSIGLR